MKKTYWFSKRQAELCDVLGQPPRFVFVDGDWARYTQSTEDGYTPVTWPDFVQVAEGIDLATKQGVSAEASAI